MLYPLSYGRIASLLRNTLYSACPQLQIAIKAQANRLAAPPAYRQNSLMDTTMQRRSLIAFYFGTTVATADVTSEEAIDGAARRAYPDLRRTLWGFGNHPERNVLVDWTLSSPNDFVNSLAVVTSQEDFDSKHEEWCTTTFEQFTEYEHPTRDFTFQYGQAQKWLNMTLKYLAVLNHPEVQRIYRYLHVPVDHYVIETAAKEKIAPRWNQSLVETVQR